MTNKHRHLFAALGFAALAVLCFSLLTWALVEGTVVQSSTGSSGRFGMPDSNSLTGYPNKVYSREDHPGVYWKIIGFLGFFGTLFTVVAVLERGSYRTSRDSRTSEAPSPDLLAKIDRACGRYPEGREALSRAKTALVDLNNPAVESTLDGFLEKVLRAPDREIALKEIQNLAKALDLFGKY